MVADTYDAYMAVGGRASKYVLDAVHRFVRSLKASSILITM